MQIFNASIIKCCVFFIALLMLCKFSLANEKKIMSGEEIFNFIWEESEIISSKKNGLGPLFNARSCSACHLNGSRGDPPKHLGQKVQKMIVRVSVEDSQFKQTPHPEYGSQINTLAVSGVNSEANIYLSWEFINGEYGDGTRYRLRRPVMLFSNLSHGPIDERVFRSPRVAPSLHSMGRLAVVKKSEILSRADPNDIDGDKISGRPNWVPGNLNNSIPQIGRFGWKASQSSLEQQVASALSQDIGITTSLYPIKNCSPSQFDCQAIADDTKLEMSYSQLKKLVDYTEGFSGSEDISNDYDANPIIKKGKFLFKKSHCDSCHIPELITENDRKTTAYTDLLLHNMGEGLADGLAEYDASGIEWRTAPLVGLRNYFQSPLLHDGRARNISEAILWHGGEALRSRETFKQMSLSDRNALLQFLKSL